MKMNKKINGRSERIRRRSGIKRREIRRRIKKMNKMKKVKKDNKKRIKRTKKNQNKNKINKKK